MQDTRPAFYFSTLLAITAIVLMLLEGCATASAPTLPPVPQTVVVRQTVVVTPMPAATATSAPIAPSALAAPSTPMAASGPNIPLDSYLAGPGVIMPSFFAMNTVKPDDYPKVPFGTLGHPGVGVWPWIERQKGVYDFTQVDAYVDAAVKHGLVDATNTVSMAITLGWSPQWYASNPNSCKPEGKNGSAVCTSSPANVQDWANYVSAVIRHYNGVTAPQIRYYEVWNEVNVPLFYTGSPAEMLSLAQVAYPIVHSDPHSMLLTPSVVGPVGSAARDSGAAWMAGYLDAGGSSYADGGAFHGYISAEGVRPFPMPEQDSTSGCKMFVTCYGSIITKANMMRQVFDQHGLAGKPMFDTEGGWGNGTLTDPDTQTEWLARWYLLQAGLSLADNLQMAEWFTWGASISFDWGNIETNGREPTQAGVAYAQVYNWLVGAKMSIPCSGGADGTWTCALTRPGSYVGLVVWNTEGSKPYTPQEAYVDYRDLAGNTVRIVKGSTVTIGAKPILLETGLVP